ncbi:MAG: DivIVA domain-containing protein, partial [Acidimicrobiales bacterium]
MVRNANHSFAVVLRGYDKDEVD